MLSKTIDISFARTTTTGDGFYNWNRDRSIQANINLYHFMHLVLADNAIARAKSSGNVTPLLRAAFHVGGHYEFYQSEGLNPAIYSYIVGDVTIELARLIERTVPGQVVVGDCDVPMPDAGANITSHSTPSISSNAPKKPCPAWKGWYCRASRWKLSNATAPASTPKTTATRSKNI